MKRLAFLFSAIAVALFAIISCVNLPNLDPGNPASNMCVIEVGIPTTQFPNGIDLNDDGQVDILFSTATTTSGLNTYNDRIIEMVNGDLVTANDFDDTLIDKLFRMSAGQLLGGDFPFTSWQRKGWYFRHTLAAFFSTFEILCASGSCSTPAGSLTGGGFVAFRVNLPDGLHYGWIELSQSYFCFEASCTGSTDIIRIAYSKTANRSIRIGEL